MSMPTRALFVATVMSFAIAGGAVPSQAGILEIILGGLANLAGDVDPVVENAGGSAKVNAEVIKGNVKARKVTQQVTRRNITVRGRSVQNYAVIDGGK